MQLQTALRSRLMRYLASPQLNERKHRRARRRRRRKPAEILYFHQVDDPFSLLTVQRLDALRDRYRLPFAIQLVSEPATAFLGGADQFRHWARNDARSIAAALGVRFAPKIEHPAPTATACALDELAQHTDQPTFAEQAIRLGEALWEGDLATADATAVTPQRNGSGRIAVAAGNARRARLGHYQSAMFYYEGEWYWGLDRLHHLEQRLATEGLLVPNAAPIPPRIPTLSGTAPQVTLEYFPSLRSPYTAIGHKRVLKLIDTSDVALKLRPVMPMMMRGIPAPRLKQQYIMADAGREGRCYGTPFGRIVDPFGPPVLRAFALFDAITEPADALRFVTSYLQAAWFNGIDITSERGLKHVVTQVGLDWQQLSQKANAERAQETLEDNLKAMATHQLWGVPSFRVTGGNDPMPFACWGQDRIWRVAEEIEKRRSP